MSHFSPLSLYLWCTYVGRRLSPSLVPAVQMNAGDSFPAGRSPVAAPDRRSRILAVVVDPQDSRGADEWGDFPTRRSPLPAPE